MNSHLLTAKNVIVQGITGTHGSFHTARMIDAGTRIIAGTSPNKAGSVVSGVPVYDSIRAIQEDHHVDVTIIFVPAPHAKAAILEAVTARIPLIVCITEGIPIHDMITVKKQAREAGVVLVGPNCPGILIPGANKLGIIPAEMGLPGSVGIVSRSGTLTYEAVSELSARGIGQRYIIGIGGDRIRGTDFVDCLKLFENDPGVHSIVLIGEIGGTDELRAAKCIKEYITKPVHAYIAGHSAPVGVQLGHAGAIFSHDGESAAAKTKALQDAGATVSSTLIDLIAQI